MAKNWLLVAVESSRTYILTNSFESKVLASSENMHWYHH